jgi:hypothetical protein
MQLKFCRGGRARRSPSCILIIALLGLTISPTLLGRAYDVIELR